MTDENATTQRLEALEAEVSRIGENQKKLSQAVRLLQGQTSRIITLLENLQPKTNDNHDN